MLTPRENTFYRKKKKKEKILRGGSNPRRCIKQDSEPNELLRPPKMGSDPGSTTIGEDDLQLGL